MTARLVPPRPPKTGGALDLRGFNKQAKEVIEAATSDGWTGRRTTSGHMLLLAPDGTTTTCITSGAGNGSGLKNAWAPILRYRKQIQREAVKPGPPINLEPKPAAVEMIQEATLPKPATSTEPVAAPTAMDKLDGLAGFMSSFSDITNLIGEVRAENERLRAENDDMRAKLDMVREALGA